MAYLELYDENILALKCEFEDRDKAKQIGSYKWNPRTKKWFYPFRRDIIDAIRLSFPNIPIEKGILSRYAQDFAFQEKTQAIKLLKDCMVDESFLKLPLYRHQRIGVKFLSEFDKAGIFDDMGVGKTLEALYIAIARKKEASKCLILCPKSVKMSIWASQIEKFTHEKFLNLDGTRKKRNEILEQFKCEDYYFLIASYETFRVSFETFKSIGLINNSINNNSSGIRMAILDEATKIKNPQTQITKKILKTHLKFALILTGTPMWNRVEDIYCLIQFIHPGLLGSTYWAFQDKYLIKGGYENHEITGYKELEDLKEKVNSVSIRREKNEVSELPPIVKENRMVELEDKEQKEAYKSMEEEMIVYVKTLNDEEIKVKAGELLTRNLRLSQIADGFLTDYALKETKYYPKSSKFKEIDSIIQDYASSHQIVIFSRFLAIIDFLTSKYKDKPFHAVNLQGKMKDSERLEAIDLFQNGKSRLFIAQINTGGMGIDLSCATIQIYIDKCFLSPAIIQQAEDRSHRRGLRDSLEIISLICKDTIDSHWEELMQRKQKQIGKFFPRFSLSKEDYLKLLGERE